MFHRCLNLLIHNVACYRNLLWILQNFHHGAVKVFDLLHEVALLLFFLFEELLQSRHARFAAGTHTGSFWATLVGRRWRVMMVHGSLLLAAAVLFFFCPSNFLRGWYGNREVVAQVTFDGGHECSAYRALHMQKLHYVADMSYFSRTSLFVDELSVGASGLVDRLM